MNNFKSFIICFIIFHISLKKCDCEDQFEYKNHQVYRLKANTEQELELLKSWEQNSDILFLEGVYPVGIDMDAIVAPQTDQEFRTALESINIKYKLIDENAQESLNDDIEPIADANRRTSDYSWTEYHELNDTYNWMLNLERQYPDIVSVFEVGESYEGRKIMGLKISKNKESMDRKAIFIEGGMHAREWISPATTNYIAHQLLTSQRSEIQVMAKDYDWYFVPHSNPDGYVFTHTRNRLWRKNRRPHGKDCFGTDPNRNFDFHWNEVGASDNPCSETYAGPTAFSELETRALAKFIESVKNQIMLYVSFHSYSQLLLYPYGHTSDLPENVEDYRKIFQAAVGAMNKRFGTKYTGGNVYDAIYPATGSSIDWVYGKTGVKYSFCYELRPSRWGAWTGFRLPASQIIPTGDETLDSLAEMVKTAGEISKIKPKF